MQELCTFNWSGIDRQGNIVSGEHTASSRQEVQALLWGEGISPQSIRRKAAQRGTTISAKDIGVLTRQLAALLKAGVALMQGMEIVSRGQINPRMTALLASIQYDLSTGSALHAALRKHPQYFDSFYCSVIEAGESAGILDALLERLAKHLDKMQALHSKIKSALTYPVAVLCIAAMVVAIIMIYVIPSFKQMFDAFGAQLPAATLLVIGMSDFLLHYAGLLLLVLGIGIFILTHYLRTNRQLQLQWERLKLRLPLVGDLLSKAYTARWTRTLSTIFAAGVPLVDALDVVGRAVGNSLYELASTQIQRDVASGLSLNSAMQSTHLFSPMVLQMTEVGEASGTLDNLLSSTADFLEIEVDDAVASLSSLIEPFLIVFLGVVIGGIVVAMYLPIFRLGQVF